MGRPCRPPRGPRPQPVSPSLPAGKEAQAQCCGRGRPPSGMGGPRGWGSPLTAQAGFRGPERTPSSSHCGLGLPVTQRWEGLCGVPRCPSRDSEPAASGTDPPSGSPPAQGEPALGGRAAPSPQVTGLGPCGTGSFLHVGTEGPGVGRALGPVKSVCSRRGSEHLRVLPRPACAAGGGGDGPAGGARHGQQGRGEPARRARCCPGVALPRGHRRCSPPTGSIEAWRPLTPGAPSRVQGMRGVCLGCGGAAGVITVRLPLCHMPRTQSPPGHASQTRLTVPVEASPSLAMAPRPCGAPGPAPSAACLILAGSRWSWWAWAGSLGSPTAQLLPEDSHACEGYTAWDPSLLLPTPRLASPGPAARGRGPSVRPPRHAHFLWLLLLPLALSVGLGVTAGPENVGGRGGRGAGWRRRLCA